MIFIGIGSSIGDAEAHFAQTKIELAHLGVEVVKQSKNLKNPAQGGVAQNEFTNAVWQIEFTETKWEQINWCLLPTWRRQKLKAYKLLKVLQAVETKALRTRAKQWDDRTLDLDILMFHHLTFTKQHLLIPHPRIPERDFVLKPWQELVDKDFEIPTFGLIGELIKRLP